MTIGREWCTGIRVKVFVSEIGVVAEAYIPDARVVVTVSKTKELEERVTVI